MYMYTNYILFCTALWVTDHFHSTPFIESAREIGSHFHANDFNCVGLQTMSFNKLFTAQNGGSTSIRSGTRGNKNSE